MAELERELAACEALGDVGEVVETQTGKARVMDANIFEGSVRVKYIEEERTREHPERLGSDLFEFKKAEVKRLGKSGKGRTGGAASGGNGISTEIETALREEIIEVIPER